MIGIFDSGLSVLRLAAAVRRRLPEHDLLVHVDTAGGPWGLRSAGAIRSAAVAAAAFLAGRGARLLLCASHSAAAVAAEAVARQVDAPLLDVIDPAADAAVALSRGLRIGVLGSPAMVSSGGWEDALRRRNVGVRAFCRAAPLVLPLVEWGWLKKPETRMILKKYLHPLKVRQVDTLVCAGGHFGPLETIVRRKIGKRVAVVDPLAVLADRLADYLADHPRTDGRLPRGGRLTCTVSDPAPGCGERAARYFGGRVPLQAAGPGCYSRAV